MLHKLRGRGRNRRMKWVCRATTLKFNERPQIFDTSNLGDCEAAGIEFLPVSVETFGAWGPVALETINAISYRWADHHGESRSRAVNWIYQKLSVAVQRGNATMLLARNPVVDLPWSLFLSFLSCQVCLLLFQIYNKSIHGQLTKDEEELQCLLLLVAEHRKRISEPVKANLKWWQNDRIW